MFMLQLRFGSDAEWIETYNRLQNTTYNYSGNTEFEDEMWPDAAAWVYGMDINKTFELLMFYMQTPAEVETHIEQNVANQIAALSIGFATVLTSSLPLEKKATVFSPSKLKLPDAFWMSWPHRGHVYHLPFSKIGKGYGQYSSTLFFKIDFSRKEHVSYNERSAIQSHYPCMMDVFQPQNVMVKLMFCDVR